jgi:hypothetical protein
LKALLKKADHIAPLAFINWAIAIGIACEYILINVFIFIHQKSQPASRRWEPFANAKNMIEFFKCLVLKSLSIVGVLMLAAFGLRPYPMVVS